MTKRYDRISILVPKGRKTDVETYAREHGHSVNALVNELLRDAMAQSECDWKREP